MQANTAGAASEAAKQLGRQPVLYVTRDIERAMGFPFLPEGYYIVANVGAYAEKVAAKWPDQVMLIGNGAGSGTGSGTGGAATSLLDTVDLLQHPETEAFFKKIAEVRGGAPAVLVFKNTLRIERFVQEKGWRLLNPSASLAERLENKLTQIEALGDAARFLVPGTRIALCSDLRWEGKTFVLQFAHAHSGEGTVLVDSAEALSAVQKRFPQREARVSPFIQGPVYTNNNCVVRMTDGGHTLVGNISYQITGLAPFTDLPFATVGNDWTQASQLSEKVRAQYEEMARAAGARLLSLGWKGLFGIDAILDEASGQFHLLEINARQPASTTFESELQNFARNEQAGGPANTFTVFEAHLLALFDHHFDQHVDPNNPYPELQKITDGGQIVQRLTKTFARDLSSSALAGTSTISARAETLRSEGYTVIEYQNTAPNSDQLRIQSKKGIIDSPLCKKSHTN